MTSTPKSFDISVVCPCYNEGEIISSFLSGLAEVLSGHIRFNFLVLVVNDGSTDHSAESINNFRCGYPNINVELLDLGFNQGHQKAIYAGLKEIHDKFNVEKTIVMDCDGEDDPSAIQKFLANPDFDIIQIERGNRAGWITV